MHYPTKKIFLIRHGETLWTLSGQHTGKTDISLTEKGKQEATLIGKKIRGHTFANIWVSPLKRAQESCEAAGLLKNAQIDPDLAEWNYGKYEGLTSEEIWKTDPHWNIFLRGAPQGESVEEIGTRVQRLLMKIQSGRGDVALFSHGHFLRALAARWLQLPIEAGQGFSLSPSSLSILGYERNHPVLCLWNAVTTA